MAVRQRGSTLCCASRADDADDNDDVLLSKNMGMEAPRELKKKAKESQYRLLDYSVCPDYLKDNEFILSHYRADFSYSQAFSSLFKWHNETLNIWTHLLGFVLFFVLTLFAAYELGHLPAFSRCVQGLGLNMSEHCLLESMKTDVSNMIGPMMNRANRWPFFVFMGGSMFCLLASTVCHLFTCHSKPLSVFLMRVDYAGIATMIATSFFPPIYYVFQCERIWQWIYLSTISTMGILTVGLLFAPALQDGKYRAFRALLFMSMGLSGLIPAIHGLIANWNEPLRPATVVQEVGMASCYCIGTMIYVIRVPERWKPGAFDLGGHSHNIFHLLVIGGALFHYRAALLFLEWRDSKGCS
eukprot:c21726_g1_i1 orf=753-1817(+)